MEIPVTKRFLFLSAIFLLLFPALLSARGGNEKTIPSQETVVQVTGIVRLVGSSLFQELVITGSDNEWYIEKEDRDKLHDLQHRTVTVEGIETVTELKFANGTPAGQRRELRKIKIITVQGNGS